MYCVDFAEIASFASFGVSFGISDCANSSKWASQESYLIFMHFYVSSIAVADPGVVH
jgi:hypothetical protein